MKPFFPHASEIATGIQKTFQDLGFDVTLQTSGGDTIVNISDPDSGRKIKARLGSRSGLTDDYIISRASDLRDFYRYAQGFFHTSLADRV